MNTIITFIGMLVMAILLMLIGMFDSILKIVDIVANEIPD